MDVGADWLAASSGAILPTPRPRTAPELRRAKSRGPRFLYIAFAVTLLPLAILIAKSKSESEDRVENTIAAHPEIAQRMKAAFERAEKSGSREEVDDFFENGIYEILPDGKFEGAFLPRHSWAHWILGIAAAAAFLAAVRLMFEPGESTIVQVLLVGLTTATVGIVMLLIFQWLAELSQHFWMHGASIVTVIFYIVKFIGWSYRAALDQENGFVLSLVGFTFGVGLCEEIVKAIPILAATSMDRKFDWRGACGWGLASGIGFGIAEGIMYSGSQYNGIEGADVYLVRFISCVALHATWTAAAAIMIWQNQANLQADTWYEWLLHLVLLVSVPMTLHGLYDTLLKRELTPWALLVALASFGWLIFMIERARLGDVEKRAAPSIRMGQVSV
jgi:RsiW-degrading membrane proteinase PrsW (M82 family)